MFSRQPDHTSAHQINAKGTALDSPFAILTTTIPRLINLVQINIQFRTAFKERHKPPENQFMPFIVRVCCIRRPSIRRTEIIIVARILPRPHVATRVHAHKRNTSHGTYCFQRLHIIITLPNSLMLRSPSVQHITHNRNCGEPCKKRIKELIDIPTQGSRCCICRRPHRKINAHIVKTSTHPY